MQLTLSPETIYDYSIFQWLKENYQVEGNEPELVNEPLSNLVPRNEWISLEIWLQDIFDEIVDLPKNLTFKTE